MQRCGLPLGFSHGSHFIAAKRRLPEVHEFVSHLLRASQDKEDGRDAT
jgi:hypothetical protein